VQDIKKASKCSPGRIIVRLGRIKGILAGICVLGRPEESFPAGPEQPSPARPASRPAVPGWADLLSPRLGQRSQAPAGPASLSPARPGSLSPASAPAGPAVSTPAWAESASPPGWAASSPGGLQAGAPPRPGLAPQACALAGPPGWQAGVAPQAKICRLGHFEHYSGWARSVLPWPRSDYSLLGRITLLLDEIYSLRDILLVQHRLQRIVPVLGRLQARIGTPPPPPYAGLGTPIGSDQHI
jgi:hypothetical protein